MGLCELACIIADLVVVMGTMISSSVRRDLKLRPSVQSYFLKDANERMGWVRDRPFPITFLIIYEYYNSNAYRAQLHPQTTTQTTNIQKKGGEGFLFFHFYRTREGQGRQLGEGILKMSAVKASRMVKQDRKGDEGTLQMVEQDKQSEKSKKSASEKESVNSNNKRDDVSETPILKSQDEAMEEMLYYEAGDIVFATYLGLDWPGKVIRPLKQYSLYRIQLYQLGKTVQYPIDVIKDFSEANKLNEIKNFEKAENRHADLTSEKFHKAIQEAESAKRKQEQKQHRNEYLRKVKKHNEIEKEIFDELLRQEKEREPFDSNLEEEHKTQKEKRRDYKKVMEFAKKKLMYQKRIEERAKERASKLYEKSDTAEEAVVEQQQPLTTYNINIVVVAPPQEIQEEPNESKVDGEVSEVNQKSAEEKKDQNKDEKGSASQNPSLKDQSAPQQVRDGPADSSNQPQLSQKEISSLIAQSLQQVSSYEPNRAEKEAFEFMRIYADYYSKIEEKLTSVSSLPTETKVLICEDVLDVIFKNLIDSDHRNSHCYPLLNTILTKDVISLDGLVNSNILNKMALFIKTYDETTDKHHYNHVSEYNLLRKFRKSFSARPPATDENTKALQRKAFDIFERNGYTFDD